MTTATRPTLDLHCVNCNHPGAVKRTETHYVGGAGHRSYDVVRCADWAACIARMDAIEAEHGSMLGTTLAAERHNAAVLARQLVA